jgi:hypothetical protein
MTRAYDGCGFLCRAFSHKPNEIKKTNLDNNTSPAAGISALLWAVGSSLFS